MKLKQKSKIIYFKAMCKNVLMDKQGVNYPFPLNQLNFWKIGKENLSEPGLEPETSGLPYQCSSIWAIQPLDGGPPKQSTSLCWGGGTSQKVF